MSQSAGDRLSNLPVVWAAVLGAVGFVCGFFGPMLLNPGANLGPLLVIFFGPLCLIAGLVLGGIALQLNLSPRMQTCCLILASLIVAGCVFYLVAPKRPAAAGTAGPSPIASSPDNQP